MGLNLAALYLPTIKVSGINGARPTISPPNPHPMSTTSTSLVNFRPPLRFVLDVSGSTNAGKWDDQSICAGLRGLLGRS